MQPSSQRLDDNSRRVRLIADSLHNTMALYGYERVETQIIQPSELFLTKAGDQIVTRLFTFERNGKQLALRPEFTATAAYAYAASRSEPEDVVRWQFGGPIFSEAPGQGDAGYQRHSIGGELIGLGGSAAEAEIIEMTVHGLNDLGIESWRLVMGHVGLMRRLLQRFQLDDRTERFLLGSLSLLKEQGRDAVLERLNRLMLRHDESYRPLEAGEEPSSSAALNTQQMLDALLDATQRNMTMGGRTRHDIVRRLLQKRRRSADYVQIVSAVEFLERWGKIDAGANEAFREISALIGPEDTESRDLLAAWSDVLDLLESAGIKRDAVIVRPDLERSWDYYTGVVFEVYGGGGEHLAGGGRYDELISLVGGGKDVPAVGMVYYPEQIAQKARVAAPDAGAPVAVLFESKAAGAAMRVGRALRAGGLACALVPAKPGVSLWPRAIYVSQDGRVSVGQESYSTGDVEALVAELRKVSS